MKKIRKLLIANRGEIAVRIAETARKMGIYTVTIYAADDSDSLHVQKADEKYSLGNGDLKETYLNISKIIEIAKSTACDAIHPGYGFLSENSEFADACQRNEILFIGPSSDVIKLMGNKQRANHFVKSLGLPVLEEVKVSEELTNKRLTYQEFPLLLKAVAGGGGKGMRMVYTKDKLHEAIEAASSEAFALFGDGSVYAERLIKNPRHIEVQLLGDKYGNIIHLYERECSLQRRYQKIIEEAPSVSVDKFLRKKITDAALLIGKSVGYTGAGTVEFLIENNSNFYFLEMNTRIQVEHPVTEMVTGIDIVKEQILVAMGAKLNYRQEDIKIAGHAIEARIYAEEPLENFMPSPGKILYYQKPRSENLRIDGCILTGYEVKHQYDPMLAKVVSFGQNRSDAIKRLYNGLSNITLHGLKNNISFLKSILENRNYLYNKISTAFIDENLSVLTQKEPVHAEKLPIFLIAAALIVKLRKSNDHISGHESVWTKIGLWRHLLMIPLVLDNIMYSLEISTSDDTIFKIQFEDHQYNINCVVLNQNKLRFVLEDNSYTVRFSVNHAGEIWITCLNQTLVLKRADMPDFRSNRFTPEHDNDFKSSVVSPMYGKIFKILVSEKDEIRKNDTILIIDSMKTENKILSPSSGKILRLHVREGDQVKTNMLLAEIG